jgi:hypothetical protein
MASKKNGQGKISDVTADTIDLKVIEKLELKKEHSYLLLFKTGTIPFEQAKNLAELLVDAGFKALFVAVQDTAGIKVIEKKPEEIKALPKAEAPVNPKAN